MSLDYAKFAGGTGFTAEALRPFADTEHGVAFLEKHLHPPGPPINSLDGIPDHDAMSSVVSEYRLSDTIGAPAGATTTWNTYIVFMPNLRYTAVYWSWETGSPFPTAPTGYVENSQFPWNDTVVSTMSRLRAVARSSTVYFNAPSVADQGTVFAAQLRNSTKEVNPPETDNTSEPFSQADLGELATDGDSILMMSNRSYMAPAKTGCYLSYGYTNPTQVYKPAFGTNNKVTAGNPVVYRTHLTYRAGNTDYHLIRGGATPFLDMSFGHVLFKGMSPQATLELKTFFDLEVIPSPGSSWSPFVTSGAEPDGRAMESVFKIRHHMADAYPSAANFLGALGSTLLSLGKTMLPSLGQALGSMLTGTSPQQQPPQPAARPPGLTVRQVPVPAPRFSIQNQKRLAPVAPPRRKQASQQPAQQQGGGGRRRRRRQRPRRQ
jgi:hypothetical protein